MNFLNKAILVDRKIVAAETIEWAMWFDKAERSVKRTELEDGTLVSTVFLGVNYGHDGKDLWFETMVFANLNSHHEKDCRRYETWDEAEKGHDEIVNELKLRS